jgi:hypothetical protein
MLSETALKISLFVTDKFLPCQCVMSTPRYKNKKKVTLGGSVNDFSGHSGLSLCVFKVKIAVLGHLTFQRFLGRVF